MKKVDLGNRTRAGLFLLAAGLVLFAAPLTAREGPEETARTQLARTIEVEIRGMACELCVRSVELRLTELEGVEELEVELEPGTATLTLAAGADVSNEALRRTVEEAGFEPVTIARSFESDYPDWSAPPR